MSGKHPFKIGDIVFWSGAPIPERLSHIRRIRPPSEFDRKVGDKIQVTACYLTNHHDYSEWMIEGVFIDPEGLRTKRLVNGSFAWRFELFNPFDPSKPVRTRSGSTISDLTVLPLVPERPIEATLTINGKSMRLSYDSHGRFYPGHNLEIDLVNYAP